MHIARRSACARLSFAFDYFFDLFQRKFLIGLYECSSRKTKGRRAQHATNQCAVRLQGDKDQIIENNFGYYIVAGHIFRDSVSNHYEIKHI